MRPSLPLALVLFLTLTGAALAADTAQTAAEWSAEQIADCRRSSTVGPATGGGLTLIDRDLIEYEIGRTVHAARRRAACDLVTDTTWIKKQFVLEQTACRAATLCFQHSGSARRLEVVFNGQSLPFEVIHTRARGYCGVYPKDKFPEGHKMHHLNGKPYKSWWRGAWQEVEVDPKLLRKGTNTVVIRGKGEKAVRFYIEQSVYPNRSAVSRDGGKTWDSDHLSTNRNLNGEYVVRLLLRRHPSTGWIESEPVDLWPKVDGTDVAVPARLAAVQPGVELEGAGSLTGPGDDRAEAMDRKAPDVTLLVRAGSTPEYDPETWTAWAPAADLSAGKLRGKPLAEGDYRYAQWRAELAASADRTAAHVLKGVKLTATVRPKDLPPGPAIAACRVEQPAIVRPSHMFVHARKTKRLEMLGEQAKLDEVVGGRERGFEQLRRIAQWIPKLRAGNNGGGELDYFPTWDALLFWNFARPGKIGRMCTTRGAFFVQCATALGYPARVCIWSHCIAEAWVDDLGKWVAFDPSGGHYFVVNGRPASMLEVAKAYKNPDLEVRRAWNKKTTSGVQKDRNVAWFTRFFIPMRSNFLESDEPREPAHGKYSFKYDGHLRWLHPRREPLPWFKFTTSRDGDVLFTCNTVNLHLARTSQPDKLAVQIETDMPNLERFEARRNGGEWKPVETPFQWTVSPGDNTLEVRGVNTFGLPGRAATATLTTDQ
ncbi:MAG: hypothetical protein ACOC8E_00680 [Planctomycetota bacterium]